MHVQLTSSTLCILRILDGKCLCCLPSLVRLSEVGVSGVVPWPVIWCLARYHKSHVQNTGSRPRMEALVQDFQQFAAKVRWKWHFRGETKAFYINVKNSRHTPPYPRATPPELEGWLSLLRDSNFQGSTRDHTQTQASTESNQCFTTHQTWLEVSQDQLLGGFFERQRWTFHLGA